MKPSLTTRWLCIATSLVALLAGTVAAAADVPNRVGRIALVEGRVSFYGDRDEGWREAQLNYPVTSENSIWTEGQARAEVRLGATAFRFDDDTTFDFVSIGDDVTEGYLQRGSVSIRVRQYRDNDFADRIRIETADGRVFLESDGRYRIDVSPSGFDTRVVVFSGRARFEQRETRLPIEAGKELSVHGSGSGALDIRFQPAGENGFDRWAADRDARWDRAHVRAVRENTVSPYMTGYEDLDDYGDWIDDREYGRLWAPRVIVDGWAPYRYGRWTHVSPWGWTWVDDAPWGFAPFHYGRWVMVGRRWCWWPGGYQARPAYAPALVAWFGNPGFGFSISSGPQVGWFPLAPREIFVPTYRYSDRYVRNINHLDNNVVIRAPGTYRNHIQGATIVANNVFINGRAVGNNLTRVPPRVISDQATIGHFNAAPPRRRDPSQMPDRRQNDPRPAPHYAQPRPGPGPAGSPSPDWRPKSPGEPIRVGPMPAPTATPKAPGQPAYYGAQPIPPAPPSLPPSASPNQPVRPPAATPVPPVDVQPGDREPNGPRIRGRRQPSPTESAPPVNAPPNVAPAPRAPTTFYPNAPQSNAPVAAPPPAVRTPAPTTIYPSAPVAAPPAIRPPPSSGPVPAGMAPAAPAHGAPHDRNPKPRSEDKEQGDKPRGGEKSPQPKGAIQ